jgi:outer membrane protein TolC
MKKKIITATVFLSLAVLAGCVTVRFPKIEIFKNQKEEQALTWNEVVKTALAKNPDVLQARFQVQSKAMSRDMAFGDFLPMVDGTLDRSHSHTSATKPTGTAGKKSSEALGLGLSVSQPLFTGFKTTSEFLKAKKEWEATKFDYVTTSANIRFELRSVFVELLRQYRLSKVNPEIAKRRHTNAEMISLRYDAGREHMGSLMRVEAIANQADYEVRQTERQIDNQSILLSRLMGGIFVSPLKIQGELEVLVNALPDLKPDLGALAEETPHVKSLIKTAESLKAAIGSAQADLWPQVNGTYDYGFDGNRSANLTDSSVLGLNISLPFFHGGKNIEGIRKAKADYEAAREQARSARDQAVSDLMDAWTKFQNAKEQVEVQKNLLTASIKRSEIVRMQYETGLVSFQDFDTAEQERANFEQSYILSLGEALIQEANWELAKGSTLEDVIHAK